jgi:hypothetical protein
MKRTLIAILIVAFILAGCGSMALNRSETDMLPVYSQSYDAGGAPAYPEEAFAPPMPTMMPSSMEIAGVTDGKSGSNVEAAARERMVVKNADLSVVVEDPETSMAEISKLAEEMGGFVVSSNLYQSYPSSGVMVPEASVVARVPSDRLDEAMEAIKTGAVEVQSENVSGQDVTGTYVDLESQLKNLEAAEAQLVEIMGRAEKTEDVMNVFNQLTSIRGQIESIKGQMKYYEESAALSSLSVRLIAEETIKPIEVGGWQITGWARDAVQSLVNFLQDFTKFLINLVISFLPKLLIIAAVFGLPIWLIVRAIRNAARRRKARSIEKIEEK